MKNHTNSNHHNMAGCLSILGTGSDVGKSIVVTALCRIFNNMGLNVVPYKAQNMSNNSYVTMLGGEMGRAQVVQAQAARVPLHTDMNPVLLKPNSDTGAQVVLHGKPIVTQQAHEYFSDTSELFNEAKKSLNRLRSQHELVIMEGAGSCAEINLMDRDFVNFKIAHEADAPVILVADIDRGGVFAQIIGTLNIIPKKDRQRIKGIIINRFRGDASLFKNGIDYIEKETNLSVLGLIPYFRHIEIDAEDGLPLDIKIDPPEELNGSSINMAVIRLPHISNFTDFSPLQREKQVVLHYLAKPRSLKKYDVVFLPGSKNTRGDLEWLKKTGWNNIILDYAHHNGKIIGICGGYQMLGKRIHDPFGLEGTPGETTGLGLLNVKTTLQKEKKLHHSIGKWLPNQTLIEGYEIHMGITEPVSKVLPAIHLSDRNGTAINSYDGSISDDGNIWGTYFHGLFEKSTFRAAFLKKICPDYHTISNSLSQLSELDYRDSQYDLLAEHYYKCLDIAKIMKIIGLSEYNG